MIKIKIVENNNIVTSGEVDYYTYKNVTKTIYFLGIKIYTYSTNVNNTVPENSNGITKTTPGFKK